MKSEGSIIGLGDHHVLLVSLILIGMTVFYVFDKRKKRPQVDKVTSVSNVIRNRRSIMPKNMNGNEVTKEELDVILEAANWAPTHKKTEPWRYSVFSGASKLLDYLDFIDNWYEEHCQEIPENEFEAFKNKLDGIRKEWPSKVSHVLVIGMRRGEGLPEWEELCAVAMSVQNMYLVTAAMDDVGGFWSSHTWCRRARDSREMREFVGLGQEDGNRILGAFVLGRYDIKLKSVLKASRGDIKLKVSWNQ